MRAMRPIIRTAALTLAAAGTALALAAPPASAALNPPLQRILIYKGAGVTPPVGPSGPLPTSPNWTKSTLPAKITVTGLGTFVEDTSLLWSGTGPDEWYYNITGAVLHAAWLVQGKTKTEITDLATTGDDGDWFLLSSKGVYAPGCLVYQENGLQKYAVFDLATKTWAPDTTCPPVLPGGA